MKKSVRVAIATMFLIAAFGAATAFAADNNVSANWGGYVAQGGVYTAVSGTWVVPELEYSTSQVSNATWVGIGGRASNDLIQAGVYEIADSKGATYQAWYELLPENATPVDLAVHPGDSISVAILEIAPDTWNIVITNNTTAQQFAKTVYYHSLHGSAEWIQELPQLNGSLTTLSGFTPVQFTGATAIMNGQRLPLSQLNPQTINLLDQGANVALAVPSPISNDGTSFSVFRTSAVATTPMQRVYVPAFPFPILPGIPVTPWILRYFAR